MAFREHEKIHRTKSGTMVRSKSEVIIANELADQGISFEYEEKIHLFGKRYRPDFTLEHPRGGPLYWEHLGLLRLPEYAGRWIRKRNSYREAGINEDMGVRGTLVVTADDSRGGIDTMYLSELIANGFDRELTFSKVFDAD